MGHPPEPSRPNLPPPRCYDYPFVAKRSTLYLRPAYRKVKQSFRPLMTR